MRRFAGSPSARTKNDTPDNASPAGLSRRRFLGRAGAIAAAGIGLPAIAPGGFLGARSPSERITMGAIGVGDHGVHRNLRFLFRQKDARVVAVCNVFADRRERARDLVDENYGEKSCEAHKDFRRILDRKDIDTVMIATPDHWHVLMSIYAIRAGKDVICEKPTLTIAEGRALADTVKKHKAVFQTSTEDRSLECYHRMAQVVRNGLLGKIERVEVVLPAGTRYEDEDEAPVPPGLDYDLWLGPAPRAPYTPNRTEKMHWRHISDYSGGLLTDWGPHQLDTVQWALDVERTGPVEIEGRGEADHESMYDTFVEYDITYRYASGVEVHVKSKSGGSSLRFIGKDGWIGNPRFAAACEASKDELLRWEPTEKDLRLPREPAGEHRSFLDAVKSRGEPYFPAEVGHRCSTLCHLGNIAMLTKRKLKWDPEKEEFPGDDEANALRSRPMREPWRI